MLRASGLGLFRGDRWLLRQFDLTVAPGELVAVVGPSGSGKSTLLRALAGVEKPAEGLIDRPASCGFLLQDHNLPGDLSLFEAVRTGCLRRHTWLSTVFMLPGGEERRRAWNEIMGLGLTTCAFRKIRHVSGGERQRAALARLLLAGGDLLLADEPVSNLDVAAADLALGRLRAAADAGSAVVVVLHQPELVARWCGRVITLGPVPEVAHG